MGGKIKEEQVGDETKNMERSTIKLLHINAFSVYLSPHPASPHTHTHSHTTLRAMTPWQSNDWASGGQDAWSGQHWQGSWQGWHGAGWHHGGWSWQSHGGGGQQQDADVVAMEDDEAQENDAIIAQKDLFWTSEEASRQRNTGLTCFEKHQLLNTWDMTKVGSDVNRVIAHFTNPRGAGKPCRLLMKMYMDEQKQAVGEIVSVRSPGFTLCKHMWVGMCRGLTNVNQTSAQTSESTSATSSSTTGNTCFCLPATAFMMAGCTHKRRALHTLEHQMMGLCASCSKCIRCGGCLGTLLQIYYTTIYTIHWYSWKFQSYSQFEWLGLRILRVAATVND